MVGDGYYPFDMKHNQWHEDKYVLDDLPPFKHLIPGFNEQLMPAYDDVLVCFRYQCLMAVLVWSDRVHSLKELHEVFDLHTSLI